MTDFDEVKRDFDRDGFVVLKGYLSKAEVDELRERAVPLAKTLMVTEGTTGKYRNILKTLHKHDDWFNNLMTDGKHLPLLTHLLEGDVFGVSVAWFDRPKGEGQGVGPHVDAIGRGIDANAGATIWFALDSVNIGNGCLHYLRGSHKTKYPRVIPIPGIDADSEDACAIELELGDVVIHHSLAVHWSGGNTSGEPRRAVSIFYFGERADEALHKLKQA